VIPEVKKLRYTCPEESHPIVRMRKHPGKGFFASRRRETREEGRQRDIPDQNTYGKGIELIIQLHLSERVSTK
jgi:hypothetical protein